MFEHLKKFGKKIGSFLGIGRNQEQENTPVQNANETTGQNAAAFTEAPIAAPGRGFGGHVRDLADRFKYWAGGGSKKINNTKRNWLVSGEKGSWRRNKAERLAEKEYQSGLAYVRNENQEERKEQSRNMLYSGEMSPEVFLNTVGRMSPNQAGGVQTLADKLNRYMIENNVNMGSDYDDYLKYFANLDSLTSDISNAESDQGEYDDAVKQGNGDIKYGYMRRKARDIFFQRHGNEYNLKTGDDRKNFLQEKVRQIMKEDFGMEQDSVELNEEYKNMLLGKSRRDMNSFEEPSKKTSKLVNAKKDALMTRIEGKYQGFLRYMRP